MSNDIERPDSLSITVTAHPSIWANVLRRLLGDANRKRASIRAALAEGSIRRSVAQAWLADLDYEIEPIIEAAREACEAHPSWLRWFEGTPVGASLDELGSDT